MARIKLPEISGTILITVTMTNSGNVSQFNSYAELAKMLCKIYIFHGWLWNKNFNLGLTRNDSAMKIVSVFFSYSEAQKLFELKIYKLVKDYSKHEEPMLALPTKQG